MLPPWLTLVGSVLFLLVSCAFIFFVARGCVATQESTEIRKYVTSADSVLNDSANAGNQQLQGALRSAGGDPARIDDAALYAAAQRSDDLYLQSLTREGVSPEFEEAHHYLVSSLGIRKDATRRLAEAASGNAQGFDGALATAIEDFRMSDSILRNYYYGAVQEGLRSAGQTRDQGYLDEPEPFMDYDSLGFRAASSVSGSVAAARSDPSALHGVEIRGVTVAGRPLLAGGNVVLSGSDEPNFAVTVANGGEVPETGVDVEVILDTSAERQARTATIARIEPKATATVRMGNFIPGELDEAVETTVEAGPVEYEDVLANNTLNGTVTFGL